MEGVFYYGIMERGKKGKFKMSVTGFASYSYGVFTLSGFLRV